MIYLIIGASYGAGRMSPDILKDFFGRHRAALAFVLAVEPPLMQLKIIETGDRTDKMYSSPECQQALAMYDEYYPKIGFNIPWVGYFVVRENSVVGCCGFTGQPQNGRVEIAYWTFKQFEGQGIASFACKELISISQQTDPTITITAKTAPEHNASTKVLKNNGFVLTGVVQDEGIGDAWLWTLS